MVDSRFFSDFNNISVQCIADACGLDIKGDKNIVISGVATLKDAESSDLSFFSNKKHLNELKNTKAGAVIVTQEHVDDVPDGVVKLVDIKIGNALVSYAHVLQFLFKEEDSVIKFSDTAKIHKSATLGIGCFVGENVVIAENVVIGDGVYIGHNSVIERGCVIGDKTHIGNNVSITHSLIGKNVIINSGAKLGESGFGILPIGSKMLFVKQLGRLIIGDRARIGANTTIDRGSISDTVIGNDTIIDNLVQIAHNVTIGERSIIVAQVGIAGSTTIGSDVVLAGQVGISGHINVGDKVTVAAKSGVVSNVESGKMVGGIPAVDIGVWRRQAAFLKMSVLKKKN